jgi:WD40 repeat protein
VGRQDAKTSDGVLEGHTETVICLVFGSTPNLLVSGGADNSIWVWDLPKIGAKGKAKVPKACLLHEFDSSGVDYLYLSPDDRYLMAGNCDKEDAVLVGQLELQEEIANVDNFTQYVRGVVWSSDSENVGHMLVHGGETIDMWTIGKVRERTVFIIH